MGSVVRASLPASSDFGGESSTMEEAGWKPALRFRSFATVRIAHLFSTEIRMSEHPVSCLAVFGLSLQEPFIM